ncbi:hypothetical protein [Acinetobacter junii]|uniref:hypothetical protein n=1 Tax=Acinetobacter junii TaxID=40215 RepID=UPI003A8BC9B8
MNKKIEEPIADELDSTPAESQTKLTCGIIMPIAGMGSDYPADHWLDVIKILHTAIERAGFTPRIVSESEESTVIHGSIINNIYNDAIVVCDVSNKNANVMFELGMRLAFNKPVVIVKDDKTDYSFDTGNIQHENYRKDLRHSTVEKFINDLSRKIKKTYEASLKADYQSFLSYFGKFEVARIENKSIGESEAIEKLLNKMNNLESKLSTLLTKEEKDVFTNNYSLLEKNQIVVIVHKLNDDEYDEITREIFNKFPGVRGMENSTNDGRTKITVYFDRELGAKQQLEYTKKIENIIYSISLPF